MVSEVHLFVCLSICLFVWLFVCLIVCLFVCLFVAIPFSLLDYTIISWVVPLSSKSHHQDYEPFLGSGIPINKPSFATGMLLGGGDNPSYSIILLMAEILHQLIGSLSQYLHPRWCRISTINSSDMFSLGPEFDPGGVRRCLLVSWESTVSSGRKLAISACFLWVLNVIFPRCWIHRKKIHQKELDAKKWWWWWWWW